MSNNKEKFSDIYDQYIEKIYRFVYLKVNSKEEAEDITSKVFIKGLDAYNSKKDILKPGAFLYHIATNMVTDHYRGKSRNNKYSLDFTPQIVDNKENLHEKAIINNDIENIKLAMKNINKDYQDVLIWHYLEDIPVAEISDMISKPEGTIRVMIHRGLKALRGELVEEG